MISIDPVAHQVTSVVTLVLFFKMWTTGIFQGNARSAAGTGAPEDEMFAPGVRLNLTSSRPIVSELKAVEARWERIMLNDMENIPVALVIAWSSLLSPKSAWVHTVSVLLFAAFR
ncbi:hypothetical protein HDU98_009878 [Podochytrium sp. JEL0797]|nr:hypothetical protein HDU98_009878 [Podochytrium sp. JEL0797]